MTTFTPVYNLKPTTITKAFILNALVTTIITVFTITIKKIIETHHLTKNYSEPQKIAIHMFVTFFTSILLFLFFRFLLGFGGGMLMTGNYKTFF